MSGKAEPSGERADGAKAAATDATAPAHDPFGAALLVNRIAALETQVQALQPKRKDFFDRLSQLSPLITGGAIAGVGTLATIYYASSQDEMRRLEAMDKFRTYMASGKSEEDRKFGYFALARLGQESFAIELITMKRDSAGEEVLTALATSGKDQGVRDAAQKGIAVLRSSRPGCEVEFTVDQGNLNILNGWESVNLREIDVPQLAKVPKGPRSGKVRFNVLAGEAMRTAWAEVEEKNLLDRVVSWDAAYSRRTVAGSKMLSAHACGLAFDINVAANPFGQEPKPVGVPGSVRELVPIFEKYGFRWGGNFRSRPDPGHFEFIVAAENVTNRSGDSK